MALRLGDWVECGELINTRNYSTHGWIQLRNHEQPLLFELTGNMSADLKGCHLRFQARPLMPSKDREGPRELPEGPRWRQIGVTGDMSAARMVRHFGTSVEEYYRRAKLGEPPPAPWKRLLYLEWYGQNGRVVVEIVDPILELVDADGGTREAPPAAATPPQQPAEEADAGFNATLIRLNEDGDAEIESVDPAAETEAEGSDPYGLLPPDLQQQLDAQAVETDGTIGRDDGSDSITREIELMDELIAHGEGTPLGELLPKALTLPAPDQIDDEQAEPALKVVLGWLAQLGIALDVCEHFTPRETYRLLVERILKESCAYPELRDTDWAQHFATSDDCAKCQERFEREGEERSGPS